MGGAAPVTESGNTPNFLHNAPPVNTAFPLMASAMLLTTTSAKDAGVTGATATFQSTTSNGVFFYPVIRLQVPSIGLDAPGLSGLGTQVTLPDGSTANASTGVLNYAAIGGWSYVPKGTGSTYIGTALGGYQTQAAHVPTSGIANYIGLKGSTQGDAKAGSVSGQVYAPTASGSNVGTLGLSGDANLNVNFATGAITGQLTNMRALASSSSTPWNNVNLTGTMSGSGFSGTTSTTGAPADAGTFGMSSAATGKLNGALYGPNVNELGAIWSLSESTADGGRAALGVIAATKQ